MDRVARVKVISTSRDRPKSAPYPRLKKAKRLPGVNYSFTVNVKVISTSRDRPKSAPYPRLKKAKRLPGVNYSFTVHGNQNFLKKNFRKNYILKKMDRVARRGSLARAPGALTSHNAEKLKGGTL